MLWSWWASRKQSSLSGKESAQGCPRPRSPRSLGAMETRSLLAGPGPSGDLVCTRQRELPCRPCVALTSRFSQARSMRTGYEMLTLSNAAVWYGLFQHPVSAL